MVHRREDLVASALYLNALIDRAYAAEHRRQSQLSPGFVASISETGTEKKTTTGYYMPEDLFLCMFTTGIRSQYRSIAAFYVGEKKREM